MSSGVKKRCAAKRAMHTKSVAAGNRAAHDARAILEVRSEPTFHAGETTVTASVKTTTAVNSADAIPRATAIWVLSTGPAGAADLLGPDDALGGQQRQQMGERPLDVVPVLRLERELHRVLRIADLGIRPEEELRERRERRVQVLRDRALPIARVDDAQEVWRRREAVANGVKL